MGLIFPCIENVFQACKCENYTDVIRFTNISPSKAKDIGRKVKLRKDWESVKLEFMYRLVKIKFQDRDLKTKLLATGNHELIENNRWNDRFWGKCNGIGENNLGKILMRVREEVRNGILYRSKYEFYGCNR